MNSKYQKKTMEIYRFTCELNTYLDVALLAPACLFDVGQTVRMHSL